MADHGTDTSKWALAIHRVTETSAEIWVGTLFPTLTKPKKARVRLDLPDGSVRTKNIKSSDWKRPFRNMNQRFYAVVTFKNLSPGRHYWAKFDRHIEAVAGINPAGWQYLRFGRFSTLPKRIPTQNQDPFTIGLGSCFYNHRDGGQAAGAYQALFERGPAKFRPDLTFLTGDQVYLDIGFDSLSTDPDEIRQRVADDYARNWQDLGGILNRGGTWMLPDDHEYWNDFPFYQTANPYLSKLKRDKVREAWTKAARDGVDRVQRSPRVETIPIGKDLSICLADLRSFRKEDRFLPEADFQQIVDWATGLRSPGVFAVPQPLIVEPNESERNLLSYTDQYKRLLEALAHSGHDIVLLSGDVHFGRIASCALGNGGGRLIEIISSPLSNLTYLNGIATSTPKRVPKKFPHGSAVPSGWSRTAVDYSSSYEVDTKRGFIFSAYPKARTREHFMTVSFSRRANGKLQLAAQAWRVRERGGNKNLPKQDFERLFRTTLT